MRPGQIDALAKVIQESGRGTRFNPGVNEAMARARERRGEMMEPFLTVRTNRNAAQFQKARDS